MGFATLAREVRYFGLSGTVSARARRAIAGTLHLRVMRALAIETAHREYLEIDPRFWHGFLEPETLTAFAQNPAYDLREGTESALARGDRCYAIVEGATLASYGWYTHEPATIGKGLRLEFDPRYVYRYKGFTHPRYRGQHLHAVGMTWALVRWLEGGYAGLVSYVDASNLSSLKSCARMGYVHFGTVYVLTLGEPYLIHGNAGATARGFRAVAV